MCVYLPDYAVVAAVVGAVSMPLFEKAVHLAGWQHYFELEEV